LAIKAGTINATAAGALGNGTIVLGDSSGSADVSLNANGVTWSNPIIVSAGNSGNATLLGRTGNTVFSGGITLLNPLRLVSTSTSLQIAGSGLSGSEDITVAATAGQVRFQVANPNFDGNVLIEMGTMQINNAAALRSVNAVTMLSGATLDLRQNMTIASLSGEGTVTKTTIAGGTTTLTVASEVGSTTFSGVMTDSIVSGTPVLVALTKNGAATFILDGNNTYTGATTINAGTLQIGAGGATGALGATAITNNAALVVDRTGSLELTGNIGGSGTLTKNGSGTLLLSGSNSFSGGTTIQAGNLTLSGGSAISDSGTVSLANTAGTVLHIAASETIGSLSGGGSSGGNISIASGQTLTLNQTSTGSFGGTITGSGALTKNGSATLTLSGSATHAGATTINAGTLALSGANLLSSSANVTIAAPATLQFLSGNQSLGSIAGSGIIDLGLFTLTTGSFNSTFSGTISGVGGLDKSGEGTLTLDGTGNFYGPTNIVEGILVIDSVNALRPDTVVSLESGATLTLNQQTVVGAFENNGGTLNGPGSLVTALVLTESGTLAAVIADGTTPIPYAAGIRKTTSGTTTIDADNTFTGLTRVEGGTLVFGTNGSFSASSSLLTDPGATMDFSNKSQTFSAVNGSGGTLALGSGNLTIDGSAASTTAASITGTGGLTKNGSAALTLSGSSSYSGTTSINAGILRVGHANALGDTTGGTTVASGAALELIGGITIGAEALTLSGTGIASGGALRNISGNNTHQGDITLNAATQVHSDSGLLTLSGNISGTQNLTLGGAGNIALEGIVGTSTGSLVKNGAGTLALSGANSFSGGTTLSAGTLRLDHANGLGASGAISFGGGTLQYGSGITADLSSRFSTAASQSFNIDTGANSVTFASTLAGAGSTLTKNGTGTLVLSAANSFTGATTINAGNLTVTGGSALSDSASLTLANTAGTVLHIAASETIGSLSGGGTTGGNISIAASQTLTAIQTSNGTFAGRITGLGGFTKNGTGTLVLSGSNTFSGGTTINAGNLTVTGGFALSDSAPLTLANTSGAILHIAASETVGSLSGGGSSGGNISIAASRVLTVNQTASGTFDGRITGSSAVLIKEGAGTLTLSRANSYTGGTTINAGNLTLGVANALSDSGTITLANTAGAILHIGFSDTVGALNGGGASGGNISIASGVTLTSSYNTSTFTFAGSMIGPGHFTKAGSGNLTLSGANTHTGNITITGGNLTLSGGSAASDSGNVTLSNAAGVVLHIASSETIGNLSGGGSTGGNLSIAASQTLTLNQTVATSIDGVVLGSGALTKNGSASLILTGSNTYSGGTTLNLGNLTIQNANALGTGLLTQSSAASLLTIDTTGTISNTMSLYNVAALQSATLNGVITVNNASFDVESGDTLTISGGVGGTGGVTKNGTGSLVLSGSNTYSGTTVVNAGTLEAAHANALGTNATVTVNGGSLLVSADDAINGKNLTLNSAATGNGTAASLVFSGTYNGTAGTLTLGQDSIIDLGEGSVVLHFSDLAMGFHNLSIYNWTGTTLWGGGDGNNTDQFYIDRELTSGELDRISFYSGIDTSSFVGTGYQLSGGSFNNEVIPVPEPETYATAVLLLLGLGLYFHRQRKATRRM
jgi:fibronectin-binding autotransporter adhesin